MFAKLDIIIKEAAAFLWRSTDGTTQIQPHRGVARTIPKA